MSSQPPAEQSSSSSQQQTLAALVQLGQQLLRSSEAAEVILGSLQGLSTLASYEYALLELIPGFGNTSPPTVFRATPELIQAVSPASILVDERAVLFPLASGGRELGRLRVIPVGERLDPNEHLALQALAGYMTLALRLADMETAARRVHLSAPRPEPTPSARKARGGLKTELNQILSAQVGLPVLCDRVLERLIGVMEMDAGALYTFDERTNELVRGAQRGVPAPLPARLAIAETAPAVLGRATASGKPHLVRDLSAAPLESDEDRVLRTYGFHTLLCFPLMILSTRSTGALLLLSRRTNALTSQGVALLTQTGDELALALQNAIRFERLSAMAVTDGLTSLHNRRFCEEFVLKHLTAARRSQRTCGFLLLDIDHFKSYNDRFGHAAGDAVLRGVAALLISSVRGGDLAGRYGGEEFMVALPGADLPTTLSVAERIRANVGSMATPANEPVTVSIGASCFPMCAEDQARLFSSADAALYAAKEAGRDRVLSAPVLTRSASEDAESDGPRIDPVV